MLTSPKYAKKAAIFMKNKAYWDSSRPKKGTSITGSDTFVTKNQVYAWGIDEAKAGGMPQLRIERTPEPAAEKEERRRGV